MASSLYPNCSDNEAKINTGNIAVYHAPGTSQRPLDALGQLIPIRTPGDRCYHHYPYFTALGRWASLSNTMKLVSGEARFEPGSQA